MYRFFYNLLATVTGGKKFESLQSLHLKQVKKALRGSKFSQIDTRVFALLSQRQKGEPLIASFKRRHRLNTLSVEDKQTLINGEKQRILKERKLKDDMLQKYLRDQPASRNTVQEAVNNTLSKKLSVDDAKIFHSLMDRYENESWLAHLKRSKQLYRLPLEQKRKIVEQEKRRHSEEQASINKLLGNGYVQ